MGHSATILFYFILHVREALANKMLQFQKSQMAAASIWKIENSQYFCCGWTSLEKFWPGDVPLSSKPPQHINFYDFKN